MSDKEKAIEVLKEMPDNISIKEIFEVLSTMFEINNRIDNFDINEGVTTEELLKEMEEGYGNILP